MGIDVDGKTRRVVPIGEWRSWCAFPTVTPCNEPVIGGSGDRIGRPCLDRYYGGEVLGNISLLFPIGSPGMHDPISGDGEVDVDDILSLVAAFGACGGCDEDLNGDDVVDVDDLLVVIAAWGPCP